jgi:hypothetical protein
LKGRFVHDDHASVRLFLSEALHGVADDRRKANALGGRKQGATAPKGLALDDVLLEQTAPTQRKKAPAAQVAIDSRSMKESAANMVARKEADMRRVQRKKEAEERRLLEAAL